MKLNKALPCLILCLLLCAMPFSAFGNTLSDAPDNSYAEDGPAQASEPRLVSDAELDAGAYDSLYANTIFYGDSLARSFSNYGFTHKVNGQFLGGARFIYKVGLSARYSLEMPLLFRGKNMRIIDIIKAVEADRIVVLLGVNDMAGKYPKETLDHFSDLIDAVHTESPGTEVVIEAVTPLTRPFCVKRRVSIDKWNDFNIGLRLLCEEKGVGFIDFTENLKTEEGYLAKAYSGDNKFHLSALGNDVYLRAVRIYAMLRTEENAVYAGDTLIDILLPRESSPAETAGA